MSVKAYMMSRPTPSLVLIGVDETYVTPGAHRRGRVAGLLLGHRIEVLPAAAERGKLTELRDGGLSEEQPLIDRAAAVGLQRQHGRELEAAAADDGTGQEQGHADISHRHNDATETL